MIIPIFYILSEYLFYLFFLNYFHLIFYQNKYTNFLNNFLYLKFNNYNLNER